MLKCKIFLSLNVFNVLQISCNINRQIINIKKMLINLILCVSMSKLLSSENRTCMQQKTCRDV